MFSLLADCPQQESRPSSVGEYAATFSPGEKSFDALSASGGSHAPGRFALSTRSAASFGTNLDRDALRRRDATGRMTPAARREGVAASISERVIKMQKRETALPLLHLVF